MNSTQTGWTLLIVALGMMCTLLSGDIASLHQWSDVLDPAFVGGFIAHLGAVLAAFAGGKMIPTATDPSTVSDQKRAALSKE